ncbi:MAG: family 43 glycosylhydrolase [Bacteroidales bacterium]|nr:family 43 glycosylhydrolase [Bacteroidales bacterium]
MRKILCFVLPVLALLASCKDRKGVDLSSLGPGVPTDSVYCRDPFIVADAATKTYYLFRTSTTAEGLGGVEAFRSEDLETWYGPQRVFTVPEDNFINGGVWAPEVHHYKGAWYLFATINTDRKWAESVRGWPGFTYRGTQIFRSESLDGPFLPLGKELTTPQEYMSLDGTLWVEDGVPYMIFCHEWVQVVDGSFELMPLKEDLSGAAGDPVTIFTASQAPWISPVSQWLEKDGTPRPAYVSDGNFVYKTKDGELLILWSSFKNGKYCVAISRSATGKIAGPWTCDDEPIFEEDGGHPMVFKDFDGNLKLVFHQPNSGHSHPVILSVRDTGNTLEII